MTQKDVANIVRTTDNAIGNYERGTRMPDADMLNRLSDIFDVSIDYLLGKTKERNSYKPDIHETIAAHRTDGFWSQNDKKIMNVQILYFYSLTPLDMSKCKCGNHWQHSLHMIT